MKIFRFDSEVGHEIEKFGSINFIFSAITHVKVEARVNCIHLGANGVVGYHQATIPQLFLVTQGQGWVRDESSDHISVSPGCAVFWDKGEWHESGTSVGLMAVIIESDLLNPAEFMPVK